MTYHDNIFNLGTLEKLAKNLDRKTSKIMSRQRAEGSPGIVQPNVKLDSDSLSTEYAERPSNKEKIIAAIKRRRPTSNRENITHKVEGTDVDEYSRREAGEGLNSRRREKEHFKKSDNGFTHSQSFHQVKVGSADKSFLRKIRSLKARKIIPEEYHNVITSNALIIGENLDNLPMVNYPNNDSPELLRELHVISEIMDETPLTEDTMELADEEPIELFKRACAALGVDVDDQIAPLLVQDLRRIAVILKYVHLRPRPFELAPYHGIGLTPSNFDPLGVTPSYPSVHSTIGYGLANFYADTYPEHAEDFMRVGDTIALQRIQSGQHYPSDNKYAKMIADTLFSRVGEPKPVTNSSRASKGVKILK